MTDVNGYLRSLRVQEHSIGECGGSTASAVDELQGVLRSQKIELVHEGMVLSEGQIAKFFSSVITESGAGAPQQKENIESLKMVLKSYADEPLEIRELYLQAPVNRLDVRIIDDFTEILQAQTTKKNSMRDELKELTVELRVYSVIQSMVSTALGKKENFAVQHSENLLDPKLYGYTDNDKWKQSAEYRFLNPMVLIPGYVDVMSFLQSANKSSGVMDKLSPVYKYEKDNNPLANFSTMLSDRSRPISDAVNEKSVLITDVNSRYNAVIEALSRTIDKFDKLLKSIFG